MSYFCRIEHLDFWGIGALYKYAGSYYCRCRPRPSAALCKKEYKKWFNPPPHFLPFNRHFRSRDRLEEEFSFCELPGPFVPWLVTFFYKKCCSFSISFLQREDCFERLFCCIFWCLDENISWYLCTIFCMVIWINFVYVRLWYFRGHNLLRLQPKGPGHKPFFYHASR